MNPLLPLADYLPAWRRTIRKRTGGRATSFGSVTSLWILEMIAACGAGANGTTAERRTGRKRGLTPGRAGRFVVASVAEAGPNGRAILRDSRVEGPVQPSVVIAEASAFYKS
jgi:hypothetical protein